MYNFLQRRHIDLMVDHRLNVKKFPINKSTINNYTHDLTNMAQWTVVENFTSHGIVYISNINVFWPQIWKWALENILLFFGTLIVYWKDPVCDSKHDMSARGKIDVLVYGAISRVESSTLCYNDLMIAH